MSYTEIEIPLSPAGQAAHERSLRPAPLCGSSFDYDDEEHAERVKRRAADRERIESEKRTMRWLDEESDDAFYARIDAEIARQEAAFFAAQQIARENPEWLQGERVNANVASVCASADLPEPGIAAAFVQWVQANLEWKNDMDDLQTRVALGAEAFSNLWRRKWMSLEDFQRNEKTGIPDPTNPDNVRVFLKMQQMDVRWNAWWQRQEIGKRERPDAWEAIDDAVIGRLMTQAGDSQYQFRPSDLLFRRTMEAIARENPFDPVVEHLADLESKWDGQYRLSTWLSRACGVENDEYHEAVGLNLIGGMVKRARRPGSKHDEVVILIGAQGTFKSTLCRTLASRSEYFSDSVAFDGSPQNVVPQLFGKWLIELAELDGMANRETTFLKRFISAQSDNVTLKYRAHASDYARRCVFVGTTNDDKVLRDATGNRRFLPVRIDQPIDVDWVRENLDQLLGEAAWRESHGAEFSIPEYVLDDARSHQETARAEADFETYLEDWFGGDTPTLVVAADVATLLREATGRSVQASRYGAIMRRMGFDETRIYLGRKRTRVWLRGEEGKAHRITLIRDSVTGRLKPGIGGTAGQAASFTVPPVCPVPPA